MGNKNLAAAKNAQNDEFYTQLTDIEKELRHYRKHFKGKTVLCNCDDPFKSNFFKYFAMNFNDLGLKKLIATCYKNSYTPIPHKIIITEVGEYDKDNKADLADVEWLLRNRKNVLTRLNGDGDFRSEECIEILKEADIVVTNPPFSLFREYVATLMEYNKKFIIIGNQNAITYKEIFPLLKADEMWLGKGFKGNVGYFKSPYKDTARSSQHKEGFIRVSGIIWLTNLDIKKRHEELILVKKYNPKDYPKYDNYNAINVNKVVDIPRDYKGVMGVPITFMDKYNPDQFEIINGIGRYACIDADYVNPLGTYGTDINGKHTYFRVLIRNKHPEAVKGE